MADAPPTAIDYPEALKRFVDTNCDLAKLEALAKRFNIFEALGVVWAECKHSRFLGFLLDPTQSHGLGDRFLKLFLQTALESRPSIALLTPREINILDLSQAEVHVEYYCVDQDGTGQPSRMDVLIRDARNNFCAIVENKTLSTQHSNQLERYYRLELERNPGKAIFGIYLTIEGDEPENEHYSPLSHSQVRRLLKTVCEDRSLHIDPEVQFALRHYGDMLGRHFMADEEIRTICEKIYKEHKQAIDVIVRHMPNQKALICESLRELVAANNALILDDCTKILIRFIPKSLDFPYFCCGSGWTRSKRIILFEFVIKDGVFIFLEMGPGDPERRSYIRDFALARGKTFRIGTELSGGWQYLYKKQLVERLDDDLDREQLVQLIDSKCRDFLENDLPRIEQAFLAHEWPKT